MGVSLKRPSVHRSAAPSNRRGDRASRDVAFAERAGGFFFPIVRVVLSTTRMGLNSNDYQGPPASIYARDLFLVRPEPHGLRRGA
jgi:hypothetical protein